MKSPLVKFKGGNYVVGCNYHTSWQRNRNMRFVLVDINIEKGKARLITKRTKADFWTNLNDLVWIDSTHNRDKAERLINDETGIYLMRLTTRKIAENWLGCEVKQ